MKSKNLRIAIVVVVLVGLAVGVRSAMSQFRPAEKQLPTARVKRGTLEIKVYSTGELRPTNSMSLMAPPVAGGGALQIVSLLKTGTRVNKGDVVLEFDPSEQQYSDTRFDIHWRIVHPKTRRPAERRETRPGRVLRGLSAQPTAVRNA